MPTRGLQYMKPGLRSSGGDPEPVVGRLRYPHDDRRRGDEDGAPARVAAGQGRPEKLERRVAHVGLAPDVPGLQEAVDAPDKVLAWAVHDQDHRGPIGPSRVARHGEGLENVKIS